MAGDDYSKLFERAAQIASNVPESMQDAAFRRALDLLLEEEGADGDRPAPSKSTQTSKRQRKDHRKQAAAAKETDDRAALLAAALDRTAYPQITETPRLQDKALWLLRIANDDFSIDGLSASEVSKVLKEKFRLTYSRQGVGQSLDGANRFVDRDTSGASVRYRLMAPGEAYLDNPDPDSKPTVPPKRSRSNKRKVSKTSKTSRKTPLKRDKVSKAKAPNRGRRPTPFTLLADLVASGFFKRPQTIGAIRQHMEEKQGRKYKASELSPALLRLLRSGKLTRTKNDDEQYEYSNG